MSIQRFARQVEECAISTSLIHLRLSLDFSSVSSTRGIEAANLFWKWLHRYCTNRVRLLSLETLQLHHIIRFQNAENVHVRDQHAIIISIIIIIITVSRRKQRRISEFHRPVRCRQITKKHEPHRAAASSS